MNRRLTGASENDMAKGCVGTAMDVIEVLSQINGRDKHARLRFSES